MTPEDQARIEGLIGQLTSTNRAPTRINDISVVFPHGYDRAAQDKVDAAFKQLLAEGRRAFSLLVAHLADKHYSRFRNYDAAEEIWTVGETCALLLARQIENYDHPKARGRQPPGILDLLHEGKLADWWHSREKMSLKALQLEAIDLRIMQEREHELRDQRGKILEDLIRRRTEILDSQHGLPPLEEL